MSQHGAQLTACPLQLRWPATGCWWRRRRGVECGGGGARRPPGVSRALPNARHQKTFSIILERRRIPTPRRRNRRDAFRDGFPRLYVAVGAVHPPDIQMYPPSVLPLFVVSAISHPRRLLFVLESLYPALILSAFSLPPSSRLVSSYANKIVSNGSHQSPKHTRHILFGSYVIEF